MSIAQNKIISFIKSWSFIIILINGWTEENKAGVHVIYQHKILSTQVSNIALLTSKTTEIKK